METNEVHVAFEILLEEVEMVTNLLNKDGAEAFQKGDYTKAKNIIEEATRLTEFHGKVKDLQAEWEQFPIQKRPRKTPNKSATKRVVTTKLKRGLRTSEKAYRIPILQSLNELGGFARVNDVLEKVESKMKNILNKYDYQKLPSEPHELRWRNTAQWCRNSLVNKEGLMKKGSPEGIWEVSAKGVKFLEDY